MSTLSKTCDPDRAEKLERVKRYAGIRSNWAGRSVHIYSTQWMAYWRQDARGYTEDVSQAGVWTFDNALEMTRHCGPEKGIQFYLQSTEVQASSAVADSSSLSLLAPFYRATVTPDADSMPDFLASHLAQVAEKLGYREGKEGATIPPVEWSEDEPLQTKMRAAWARGCQSGMRLRNAKGDAPGANEKP